MAKTAAAIAVLIVVISTAVVHWKRWGGDARDMGQMVYGGKEGWIR